MRPYLYYEGDSLTLLDYAEGKILFERGTRGVRWTDLRSPAKQAWALRAREERRAVPTHTYVVVGMGGSTERVEAATMAEAIDKALVVSSRVLSVTKVG